MTSTPATAQHSTRSGHGTTGAGSRVSGERAAVSTARRRFVGFGGSPSSACSTNA